MVSKFKLKLTPFSFPLAARLIVNGVMTMFDDRAGVVVSLRIAVSAPPGVGVVNVKPGGRVGVGNVAGLGVKLTVCVPGAPNKAIAALTKMIPDDWALALVASQGPKFRKV